MFSRRTPRQNRGRVGGFGISFKPTQLPGLVLWLRADLGVSVGTGVSAWADQSGNGNNATQGTGSSQPTYNATDAGYGGRPTVQLASASNQFLQLASLLPAQPFTAYVVGESTSGAAQQQFFGDTVNNTALYFAPGGPWSIYAGVTLPSTNNTQGSKQAFAAIFNTGANSAIYINSSSVAVASGNAGTNPPTGVSYIGRGAGGVPLNGKIAEFAVFNTLHGALQRSQMFAYFAGRYRGAWA